MSKDYNHETGYERLLRDFERYQKETPRGVTLVKGTNSISLQFKIGDRPRSKYGCNCSFTLDGMVDALKKAKKVAEALKSFTSEVEFWEWYNQEIKEERKIKNDLITFGEAIALVKDDFWSRPSRTRRKRDKNNPSDINCWNDAYGRFYRLLDSDKTMNLADIKAAILSKPKGSKAYKMIVSVMKALARFAGREDILKELNKEQTIQTDFKDLQTITLDDFLGWRSKILGVTSTLHPNTNIETRERWLWAFSMQIVYGLRIHEVFAIQNLDKDFVTKDKVTIQALNNPSNISNLIVIGEFTAIGTTTKTKYRIARPIIPPQCPLLIELLEVKKVNLPTNKPSGTNPDTTRKFYCNTAIKQLIRWESPITQTHAFRHLANIHGMQAGIRLEIRAQSLGHTPTMNDRVYKKRQATKTTIDLLLNSNTNAIDFMAGLSEAKKLLLDYPDSLEVIAKLIARVYSKDEREIIKLLS